MSGAARRTRRRARRRAGRLHAAGRAGDAAAAAARRGGGRAGRVPAPRPAASTSNQTPAARYGPSNVVICLFVCFNWSVKKFILSSESPFVLALRFYLSLQGYPATPSPPQMGHRGAAGVRPPPAQPVPPAGAPAQQSPGPQPIRGAFPPPPSPALIQQQQQQTTVKGNSEVIDRQTSVLCVLWPVSQWRYAVSDRWLARSHLIPSVGQ